MVTDRIFVDESGIVSLSSKSKRYCVFGFVYCKDPSELRKRLKRYLKKLHKKNQYPQHLQELKFNLPYHILFKYNYSRSDLDSNYSIHMPEIRSVTLKLIHKYSDGVFAAILDKNSILEKNTWTEEKLGNFIFAQTLIVNILNELKPTTLPIITYDKGRIDPAKSYSFNTYMIEKDKWFDHKGLKKYNGSLSTPMDVSSNHESGIWAADFVAGSIYHKYANNQWHYANFLNSKNIGTGERIFWENETIP